MADSKFRFYRDTWQNLPAFDTLRAESEGDLKHNFVTLAAASRQDAMGLVFTGKLRVTEEGDHTFTIRAKDGIRVTVGGNVIYEAAGLGETSHSAVLRLWPGHHDFRVDYFNTYDCGPFFTSSGRVRPSASAPWRWRRPRPRPLMWRS